MGVMHLAGAGLLFLATTISANGTFYWIILGYSLLYMPTIALSNSVAFHQMSDPGKPIPWIRVFGTIGWIVAGLLIGGLGIEKTESTFHLAAGASALLGLVSFALRIRRQRSTGLRRVRAGKGAVVRQEAPKRGLRLQRPWRGSIRVI